jgi:hypothetical protein
MKSRLAASTIVLTLSIGLLNAWPQKAGADDVCGHCFRIALWYWENEANMGADEIYDWLGTCLDIHSC